MVYLGVESRLVRARQGHAKFQEKGEAMNCLPYESSVIYRTGLEARDYREAIQALKDAMKQDKHRSEGCTVCYDSGHTAEQCHHNPLVMARRAAKSVRVWRCFHCDAVFTDAEKAAEHFGRRDEAPACKRKRGK